MAGADDGIKGVGEAEAVTARAEGEDCGGTGLACLKEVGDPCGDGVGGAL